MIERICTSNNAIRVAELLQKINELIDQVNTLTADVQMLPQKEEENNIDWDAFRAEAAKDILASISVSFISVKDEYLQRGVALSVKLADELIKQLKEKQK